MEECANPWFNAIPHNVKLSRVGLHFDIVLGKMLCPSQPDPSYTLERYYCAANVHFDGISSDNLKEMWFNSPEKERYAVKAGDLLIVEGGAGAGGCSICTTTDDVYIQNSIMLVRSKGQSSNRYLKFLIESLVGQGYIDFVCNCATIPHFTKEKLSQVPFPVFSLEEQEHIADYLEAKTSVIDALIQDKEAFIADLQSYRKSLIYEVVTGKRKVV